MPFGVTAASEENLSAGTAAWVNGTLLLGTGGDNQSYYENGYKEGKKTGRCASVRKLRLTGTIRRDSNGILAIRNTFCLRDAQKES